MSLMVSVVGQTLILIETAIALAMIVLGLPCIAGLLRQSMVRVVALTRLEGIVTVIPVIVVLLRIVTAVDLQVIVIQQRGLVVVVPPRRSDSMASVTTVVFLATRKTNAGKRKPIWATETTLTVVLMTRLQDNVLLSDQMGQPAFKLLLF